VSTVITVAVSELMVYVAFNMRCMLLLDLYDYQIHSSSQSDYIYHVISLYRSDRIGCNCRGPNILSGTLSKALDIKLGARGSVVVEAQCSKSEGHGFELP
jgi:hypothetical protein